MTVHPASQSGPIRDDELDALFGGLLAERPFVLAVSGGADSMALMHLTARWLRLETRPVRSPLVATVDHGLRPEAAAEALFVAEAARKLGFAHSTLVWHGRKPATALQIEARAARYALLARSAIERDGEVGSEPPAIVTAHHVDDQAETFVMRLARGSGLDGLSAMRPIERLPLPGADQLATRIDIIRPLLAVPKARLVATLSAAGIPWCEDASNDDEHFERVRVRRVLEQLTSLGIDTAAISTSAARLARARAGYLDLMARGPLLAIDWHCGVMGEISLAGLAGDVRVRLLQVLLAAFGGEAPPARLTQIEALAGRLSPAADETLGGCRITSDGTGRLRVWREVGRGLPSLNLQPGQTRPWDGGRFVVSASAATLDAVVTVGPLGMEGWAELKRAEPALAELRLPAAAVAALPAFRWGARRTSVPTLDELLVRAGTGRAPVDHGSDGAVITARFAGRARAIPGSEGG